MTINPMELHLPPSRPPCVAFHELILIKESLAELTLQLKTINHLHTILESDLSDALPIQPY